MNLSHNIAFDNGINGVVVHKTYKVGVTVVVEGNTLFNNGRTSRTLEGRQKAGGFVINNAQVSGAPPSVIMIGNRVETDPSQAEDMTYQCFGGCSLAAESSGNEKCNGASSSSFPSTIFANHVCAFSQADADAIRLRYPTSDAPEYPQYAYFQYPATSAPTPETSTPTSSPTATPTKAKSCEVENAEVALPSGKTWSYYTYGCRTNNKGSCYSDASFCTAEGGVWQASGICGAALGIGCGCCAGVTGAPSAAPTSTTPTLSPMPLTGSPTAAGETYAPSTSPTLLPTRSPSRAPTRSEAEVIEEETRQQRVEEEEKANAEAEKKKEKATLVLGIGIGAGIGVLTLALVGLAVLLLVACVAVKRSAARSEAISFSRDDIDSDSLPHDSLGGIAMGGLSAKSDRPQNAIHGFSSVNRMSRRPHQLVTVKAARTARACADDDAGRAALAQSMGWTMHFDEANAAYYYVNDTSGESNWTLPERGRPKSLDGV